MRPLFLSLYGKLALALIALSALLSLALASLLEESHKAFHVELHQQLFRSLAAQLLLDAPARDGELDTDRLFARVRELNITSPGLAAYLVSHDGAIMKTSRPDSQLRRRSVAIEPIREFVQGPTRWPLTGDDPLSETRRTIFSAAIADTRGDFLYIVLDSTGDDERSQFFPAERAHSTRAASWLMLGNVAAALLAALAAVWFITKPIARLGSAMKSLSSSDFRGPWRPIAAPKRLRDEIDQLSEIFDGMASKISAQFKSLRREDELRRELFANISHDLRTPLTAIHGYAERLATRPDLGDSDRQRYTDIIRRQASDLAALVEHIMELAKLDAPETRPTLARLGVLELVREVVAELQPIADDKRLRVETTGDALEINADAELLRRAIRNLLDNAYRLSPVGGAVEIVISNVAHGVEIAVSDRGPGVPLEELEYIFQRFYRGKVGAAGGSGLGLAIARRIAELHGGSVSAERRPGGGATFRIMLPAAKR